MTTTGIHIVGKSPLVSVVMAVHNGGIYLLPAVQSVLQQTFSDFEFVIVNDGSTDDTATILAQCAEVDHRLRVFHQAKSGTIAAVNFGISVARGTFIARMDADDIAVQERLELQINHFEANPETELLGGHHRYMTDDGPTEVVLRFETSPQRIRDRIGHVNQFSQPTTMFRRQTVMDLGLYRRAFVHCEDYDLWLRFAERYPTENLDVVLLSYRIHPRQTSQRFLVQQATAKIAASVSSQRRRLGLSDPFEDAAGITLEMLNTLGIGRKQVFRKAIENQVAWMSIWRRVGRPEAAATARTAAQSLGDENQLGGYARARLLLEDGVASLMDQKAILGAGQTMCACLYQPRLFGFLADIALSRVRRYGWHQALR